MKRIPEKNPQPGFGGDNPEFMDRGKGGDKPDFADLVTGKCKGRTSRDQITFYRNVGNQGLQFSSVGGCVYQQAVKRKRAARFRPSGSCRISVIRRRFDRATSEQVGTNIVNMISPRRLSSPRDH